MRTLLPLILSCLVLLGGVDPGSAQTSLVPDSREEITLSFAPLVKEAAPAVVNIYTRRVVRSRTSPLFDDPLFRRFFGDDPLFGGIPRERVQNSLGSGVILDPRGLIVTNAHVIEDGDEITVALNDRREFDAKVVLTDERTDLAVLRIDTRGERLPALELRNIDEIEVGDLVLAIGNPFGVGQTVTSGIVSAVARNAAGVSDYNFFIQTDAAINPGNSGGALITMDGRLVGINTAIYSRTGGSHGIGFAIPSNMVRTVIEAARSGGSLVRPWIGLDGQPVTAEIAASLELNRPVGVLVTDVWPGGPADRAGVRRGDVVLAIGGREVDGPEALRFRVATMPLDSTTELTVLRQGRRLSLPVRVIAPPEGPPRNTTVLEGRHPLSGTVVANLSPALIEELGLPASTGPGVVILDIGPVTPASRLRLRPGDVVLGLNGAPVDTVADLVRTLRRTGGPWRLSIRRGEQVLNLTITG